MYNPTSWSLFLKGLKNTCPRKTKIFHVMIYERETKNWVTYFLHFDKFLFYYCFMKVDSISSNRMLCVKHRHLQDVILFFLQKILPIYTCIIRLGYFFILRTILVHNSKCMRVTGTYNWNFDEIRHNLIFCTVKRFQLNRNLHLSWNTFENM